MALIVVLYLLFLPIVWLDVPEAVYLTAGLFAALVVPAMACTMLAGTRAGRYAGLVGVIACAGVAAFTLAGLWAPGRGRYEDTWFAFAGASALFAPLVVCCLVNVGFDGRHWRWVGVACAACAAAGMVYSIVNGTTSGEKLFAVIVSVAVLVAHANLVLLVPLAGGQVWIRWGTLAAALVTAVCVDVTVWADVDLGAWELAKRLAGAAAIVAGCGSLALLVLARLNRKVDRPTIQLDSIREFTMVCPVCGKRHTLATGESRCPTCNLIVHTRFEEPRCPQCDYSLLMLESDKCPECGTAVAGRGGAGGVVPT
jgi:hypothetical protein